MRGDLIYEIYGVHEGREKNNFFGAFRTPGEAQDEINRLTSKVMNGENWAQRYHNKGFSICSKVVNTDFEIPSLPIPRDKYCVATSSKPNQPGTWNSTCIEVFMRGASIADDQRICQYDRNYAMLQTFEPFRQHDRHFALISREYTRTAVMDLASGDVIAEESVDAGHRNHFCPVGFFVPDWWDLHDGSVIPGSQNWSADKEWPVGNFGFVWGCVWGDDSSWKVQHLDLSRIQDGVILRDERFGYIELAADDYTTPCLTRDRLVANKSAPPSFIKINRYNGIEKVTFAVEMAFNLQSGKSKEWRRLTIENFE